MDTDSANAATTRRADYRYGLGLTAALLLGAGAASAQTVPDLPGDAATWSSGGVQLAQLDRDERTPRRPRPAPRQEPERESWSFAFDNDALVPTGRDQDYTYGLSFSYTGRDARDAWYSMNPLLTGLDRLFGVDGRAPENIDGHSIEFGLFGFTPEAKEVAEPLYNDRPYASLIYLSQSRTQIDRQNNVAWYSSLTVGALGLAIVGNGQNAVHKVIGSERAEGWDHQVSDGGEPTARYTVARQKFFDVGDNLEVKSTLQASAGYITEARWSLSFRGGRLADPWWRFNPELTSYGDGAARDNGGAAPTESYLWGGAAVVARGYNAFLQGQFRDSEVTYDSDELNHMILEAWLGYTHAFDNGWRVSYVLRGHTSEVREGTADRNVLWGGLILAKTF
ncbi:MAG: lipid A deacylase LpxR family protein [Alcanivorax sp.]|uniref:lipid A deacylase LpxR family protein n=1 Tax=Alloalcanivorax marinus TaxID=1177169 RepID=UPI00195E54AD|nr:lipid A deacylase LpxR family protein [Alloalcanivorax marinus]MBM7333060.1 lipid A deacylase LpxR family protein [Alloalcanivorax marinus]